MCHQVARVPATRSRSTATPRPPPPSLEGRRSHDRQPTPPHQPTMSAPRAMTNGVYASALLCALLLGARQSAAQQHCPVTMLETMPDVVAPCCEAMPSGTCADGFPPICPLVCAQGLVNFWEACESMIGIFADDQFEGFLISGVREMMDSCRQVSRSRARIWLADRLRQIMG
eukprot:SAG31_NODE_334_length_17513_cov_10.799989_4_plen_172_part_00